MVASDQHAVIATLGMFIIDTVRYEDATGTDCGDRGFGEQVGGGGTHWAIGARVWLEPSLIRMIVDRGNDFPDSVQRDLDRYSSSLTDGTPSSGPWQYRNRQGKTTKAVNVYRMAEPRRFAYLTPKLRLDPTDLVDEAHARLPDFLHCICSPERLAAICRQVDVELREKWPASGSRPCVAWEPIPDSAVPENLADIVHVAASVDVISPNHEELASMLGIVMDESSLRKEAVEDMARRLLEQIKHRHPAVVPPVLCVRCAALGALTSVPDQASFVWVDAYFQSTMQDRLVDVTGAGNSFLGGFTAGLQQTGRTAKSQWTVDQLRRATEMGSISASYTIEVIGVPRLTKSNAASTIDERWNEGESPRHRLAALQERNKQ